MNVLPDNEPGLTIEDSAVDYLKSVIAAQTAAETLMGIRVHVKKAGCSGYEYDLTLAKTGDATPHDFCFERAGVAVIIDQATYLKFFKGGTILSYQQEGLNEGLQFNNPNVVGQCGCGESFTLANDAS